MKKLSFYLALFTCMVFHAGDAMARRAAVVFDATLTPTCAPWDGAALNVVVDMPASGQKFTATLWRQGLDDLRAGKPVTLKPDGGTGMDSNGYANFCHDGESDKACPAVTATIQLPVDDGSEYFSPVGTLSIEINWLPDRTGTQIYYPIRPKFIEAKPICG